jgi:hypothetical protein
MYEAEFVIPINNTIEKYRQRLLDFKRIGLMNIPPNKKIKVVLLAQKGTVSPKVTRGWPANCDVMTQECGNDFHVFKLCNYYLKLQDLDSKWYCTVDDDSVTNVGGLLNSLSDYSHQKKVYLSTPYYYNDSGKTLEIRILEGLGLLGRLKGKWDHDWESHFISRAAMKEILARPANKKYIRMRKQILDGYTDQFMSYAAKIAGITPIEAYFSSSQSEVDNFSLFGGKLDHIHYVAHDYKNIDVFKNWVNHNG